MKSLCAFKFDEEFILKFPRPLPNKIFCLKTSKAENNTLFLISAPVLKVSNRVIME